MPKRRYIHLALAKLGMDQLAVVDPGTMSVQGGDGLAVVDASVMPYVTNGNIYAPVMMLAERASDLILGNQTLAVEEVDFFVADKQATSAHDAS